MVSETFLHLNQEKRDRVTQALLTEFSQHSVATAQVARIVKEAGIARGAFYVYFDSLEDAYRYLFGQAMTAIHAPLAAKRADPFALTAAFVEQVQNGAYAALMRLHFSDNEGIVPAAADEPATTAAGAAAWAVKVLCHETIRACLLAPATTEARLDQLKQVLATIDVPTRH